MKVCVSPPCHIRLSKSSETLCGIYIDDEFYLNSKRIYVNAERFVWVLRDKVWCQQCKEEWNRNTNHWNQQLP